jgi:hypothetical protein
MTGAEVFLDTNIRLCMILTQMNQHAEVDALVRRTLITMSPLAEETP